MSGRRLPVIDRTPFPAYVVWELTLACDQRCTFCGSRAADARANELSTSEALDVVAALAELGAREVVLIGGEAYLHQGVTDILEALREHEITASMTTGGRSVDASLALRLAAAGLQRASVSVDGLGPTHDRLRASPGSFAAAMAALGHFADAGIEPLANTNINRVNQADLEPLFEVLAQRGIRGWQVQLTAPLGRAADRTEMLLQPWDLLGVIPRVAALKDKAKARGILLMPGNNLGYFGPEEGALRSSDGGKQDHWMGCAAGRFVMGIESDGTVKGCPSLQTADYAGGNLRDVPLSQLWRGDNEIGFSRGRDATELWGYCESCVFADTCLGGCTFTAHAVLGRPGNNPYCHYRAREHEKRGLRERLVPRRAAAGKPFDNGTFEIVVEPFDAPVPAAPSNLLRITRPPIKR